MHNLNNSISDIFSLDSINISSHSLFSQCGFPLAIVGRLQGATAEANGNVPATDIARDICRLKYWCLLNLGFASSRVLFAFHSKGSKKITS